MGDDWRIILLVNSDAARIGLADYKAELRIREFRAEADELAFVANFEDRDEYRRASELLQAYRPSKLWEDNGANWNVRLTDSTFDEDENYPQQVRLRLEVLEPV